MKTSKRQTVANLIVAGILVAGPAVADLVECYGIPVPIPCPTSTEPSPHGGCTRIFDSDNSSVSTEGATSTAPNCRMVRQSYCSGYSSEGSSCGSTCGTWVEPTGYRAVGTKIGTGHLNVILTIMVCADFDWVMPGDLNQTVHHEVCAPLCIEGQEQGSTQNINVTECDLTSDGCIYHD